MSDFENFMTARNSIIDNAVYNMLLAVASKTPDELPWDMEVIGPVADVVETVMHQLDKPICRPWTDDDERPCYETGHCKCKNCAMKS